MSIIAGRIDNRLLHGIVATQWNAELKPQRIMVIDDEVATSEVKKGSMRMAKPAGAALSIITHETALANFKAGKYDGHTVFVIARKPQTFVDIIEAGQKLPKLILGGTVVPAEGEAATQVSRRAYVLDEDVPAYQAIAASGTDIEIRFVPADKAERLSDHIAL